MWFIGVASADAKILLTRSGRRPSDWGSNVASSLDFFGLMAGFMASNIVRSSGQGLLLVLGVVGAVVSGYLFTAIGATGLTGSNLYSMFVAIIGAVVVLWLYHPHGSSV